jgi:hypothetical protein
MESLEYLDEGLSGIMCRRKMLRFNLFEKGSTVRIMSVRNTTVRITTDRITTVRNASVQRPKTFHFPNPYALFQTVETKLKNLLGKKLLTNIIPISCYIRKIYTFITCPNLNVPN